MQFNQSLHRILFLLALVVHFSISYCSDPSQLLAIRTLPYEEKVKLLQEPLPLEGVDLYDLIGLDKSAYLAQDRKYSMIEKACEEMEKVLRREIIQNEDELKKVPEQNKRTRENIQIRILGLKQKLDQVNRACAQLADAKFRLRYQAILFKELATPKEALAAYEKAKNAAEAKMRLSPSTKIFINDLLGDVLSQFQLPPAATKLFNQNLAIRDFHLLPKPLVQDITYFIGFSGITEFNNFSFKLSAYLIWDRKYQRKWMVELETPQNYKISDLLPSLKFMNSFAFPQSKMIISSFTGKDAEGFPYGPGFNFSANWDIFSGPIAKIFDNLKRLTSQALVFETRPVYLRGVIPYNPLKSSFESRVPVYLGIDFTKMRFIPNLFSNVFNKITSDEFVFKIKPYEHSALIDAQQLKSKLEEEKQNIEQRGASSAEWLEYSRLQAITKKEQEIAEAEKKIKSLEKKEAERLEKQLETKGKPFPEKITEPIYPTGTKGIIEEGIQALGTGTAAPLQKGVERVKELAESSDLFQQRQEGELPPSPPGVISAAVDGAKKLGFIVEAQTGIVIHLGTQRNPIKLTMKGLAIPPGLKHPQGFVSLVGKLQNMIEFGWLAIGNAALSIDFDFQSLEVLIALGIPISGLGIQGQIDLGKPGEARASLKADGGIAVTSEFVPNIVFDVSAQNIRLADIVSYATYLAAQAKLLKKEVPVKKIPTMTLHNLWGYASLVETRIGERVYRAGIGVQVETELFDKKAGFRIFMGDAQKGYTLEGFGYGPALSFSKDGKNLFRLYGADRTQGPRIHWNFNPIAPLEGTFGLDSTVDIPALAVSQKAFFEWSGYMISADFLSKFAGFDVIFKIDMNTKAGVAKVSAFDENKLNRILNELATVDKRDMRTVAAMALLREASQLYNTEGLEIAHLVEQHIVPLLPEAKIKEAQGVQQKAPSLFQRARQLISGAPKVERERQEELSDREKRIIPLIFQSIQGIAKIKVFENEISKQRVENARVQQLKKDISDLIQRLKYLLRSTLTPNTPDEWQNFVEKVLATLSTASELSVSSEEPSSTSIQYFEKKEVELDPVAKWRGLLITFGFAGDFSSFLSQQAAPVLREWQEQAQKGLQRYREQIAQWKERGTQFVNQEIEKNNKRIAQLESEIKAMQNECRKRPYLKQVSCQAAIKKKQASVFKKKQWNARYLSARKKGYSAIANLGKVWELRYKALEQLYKLFARGAELTASGIDFLNIKKAVGQYGFEDMINFRLPRLVELSLTAKIIDTTYPLTLRNLQFDFTKPIESGNKIVRSVLRSLQQSYMEQHLKDFPSLQRVIGDPFAESVF